MSDRELLELAAKAAGIRIESWYANDTMAWVYPIDAPANDEGEYATEAWNPLTGDGDALRLVVTLRLEVAVNADWTAVGPSDEMGYESEQHKSDAFAATRLAIVRAAAEIGRAMP